MEGKIVSLVRSQRRYNKRAHINMMMLDILRSLEPESRAILEYMSAGVTAALLSVGRRKDSYWMYFWKGRDGSKGRDVLELYTRAATDFVTSVNCVKDGCAKLAPLNGYGEDVYEDSKRIAQHLLESNAELSTVTYNVLGKQEDYTPPEHDWVSLT